MPQKLNLVGRVFGRLRVISEAAKNGRMVMWNCLCDCGKNTVARRGDLLSGGTSSCGCLKSDTTAKNNSTHGDSRTPEHMIWCSMLQRCRNKNSKKFKDYGGRGITVCERWLTYENFISDMGRRPSPKHSIERRDNNAGYSPENCVWATRIEQNNNQRDNVIITLNGQSRTMSQWSRVVGIDEGVLQQRRKRGWSDFEILATPLNGDRSKI